MLVAVKNPVRNVNETLIEISPNPLNSQDPLSIITTLDGEIVANLMDVRGRILKIIKFNNNCETRIPELKPGTYLLSFESKNQLVFKKLLVIE